MIRWEEGPFNHCLLFRSAANLAAGESPATKRSISTSEDAEPADGEPPVKRSEMPKTTFLGGEGRLSANYSLNCHLWISSNWICYSPPGLQLGKERRRRASLVELSLWGLASSPLMRRPLLQTLRQLGRSENWDLFWVKWVQNLVLDGQFQQYWLLGRLSRWFWGHWL